MGNSNEGIDDSEFILFTNNLINMIPVTLIYGLYGKKIFISDDKI